MRDNSIDLVVCTSHHLSKATGKQLHTNTHTENCINEHTHNKLIKEQGTENPACIILLRMDYSQNYNMKYQL